MSPDEAMTAEDCRLLQRTIWWLCSKGWGSEVFVEVDEAEEVLVNPTGRKSDPKCGQAGVGESTRYYYGFLYSPDPTEYLR